MSISGCSAVSSMNTHPASARAPNASSPSVRAEPHPQTVDSLIATSRLSSATDIATAPGQWTWPRLRGGDSGTHRRHHARGERHQQRDQKQPLRAEVVLDRSRQDIAEAGPDRDRDRHEGDDRAEPVVREVLAHDPVPERHRGRAHPGEHAPRTTGTNDSETPLSTPPTAVSQRIQSSTRRLPNRSPRRPTSGVTTAPAAAGTRSAPRCRRAARCACSRRRARSSGSRSPA